MGIPAIPSYLNKHLAGDQAPSGHRFGLYFPVWRNDWEIDRINKKDALQRVLAMGRPATDLLSTIRSRQKATADTLGQDTVRCFEAVSTAPFLTGVGLEHPVENGFAFLSPYGLPYLAGSGVKGVLRKAAEEMALMPDENYLQGWDILSLWQLFGFEAAAACLGCTAGLPREVPELIRMAETRTAAYRTAVAGLDPEAVRCFMVATTTAEQRKPFAGDTRAFLNALVDNRKLRESLSYKGALSFWDVFPKPAGNTLAVDILNPHHGKYYQDGATPVDCESPVPNFFLVLPSGSGFVFHVQCNLAHLCRIAPELAEKDPTTGTPRWKTLLAAAFTHAFDWLGFGAKTAVGYGQMRSKQAGGNGQSPGMGQPKGTGAPPAQAVWESAHLTWHPNTGTLVAQADGRKAEAKRGENGFAPPEEIIARLKKGKIVRANVTVEAVGNAFRIVRVEAV